MHNKYTKRMPDATKDSSFSGAWKPVDFGDLTVRHQGRDLNEYSDNLPAVSWLVIKGTESGEEDEHPDPTSRLT